LKTWDNREDVDTCEIAGNKNQKDTQWQVSIENTRIKLNALYHKIKKN
jgi:hypothetical protein